MLLKDEEKVGQLTKNIRLAAGKQEIECGAKKIGSRCCKPAFEKGLIGNGK